MQITRLNHYNQIQLEDSGSLVILHFQYFNLREIARTLWRMPTNITRVMSSNSCYGAYASKSAGPCLSGQAPDIVPSCPLFVQRKNLVWHHPLTVYTEVARAKTASLYALLRLKSVSSRVLGNLTSSRVKPMAALWTGW